MLLNAEQLYPCFPIDECQINVLCLQLLNLGPGWILPYQTTGMKIPIFIPHIHPQTCDYLGYHDFTEQLKFDTTSQNHILGECVFEYLRGKRRKANGIFPDRTIAGLTIWSLALLKGPYGGFMETARQSLPCNREQT